MPYMYSEAILDSHQKGSKVGPCHVAAFCRKDPDLCQYLRIFSIFLYITILLLLRSHRWPARIHMHLIVSPC
jgi:hypothetical protein